MISFVATDFDGTIHHAESSPRIADGLVQWLLRARHDGVKWAICSGRELNEDFVRELEPLGHDPVPDFIVTVEREIQGNRLVCRRLRGPPPVQPRHSGGASALFHGSIIGSP